MFIFLRIIITFIYPVLYKTDNELTMQNKNSVTVKY